MQTICGLDCAIIHANNLKAKRLIEKAKQDRQEYRAQKLKLKPRSQWIKEAQSVFNKWIRARDKDLPCISCGQHKQTYDAGHYRTTAAAPELRFNEFNVHKQCVQCNQHQHGNVTAFRANLLQRIGKEIVETYLEAAQPAKKYTIDELKAIIAEYKSKLKALNA